MSALDDLIARARGTAEAPQQPKAFKLPHPSDPCPNCGWRGFWRAPCQPEWSCLLCQPPEHGYPTIDVMAQDGWQAGFLDDE